MISGPNRLIRIGFALLLGLVLAACGAKQVVVQGNFPPAVNGEDAAYVGRGVHRKLQNP